MLSQFWWYLIGNEKKCTGYHVINFMNVNMMDGGLGFTAFAYFNLVVLGKVRELIEKLNRPNF